MKGMDDLCGVPPPQLLEAPLSWLSRVALMQGTRLRELLQFLGLDPAVTELELAVLKGAPRARAFGRHLNVLSHSLQILANIGRIDPQGRVFLLREGKRASFRFCPTCYGEQREPHVPVEWRVSSWRYCPLHRCLLLSACHQCGSAGTLPSEMRSAGGKRRGIAYLRSCQACGANLADAKADALDIEGPGLTATERCLLKNGRASLAAFYSGKCFMAPASRDEGIRGIYRLERQGLIPTNRWWLDVVAGSPG